MVLSGFGRNIVMESNMKKILVIFGTRPEAIKMAPVVKVLKATPGVETRVCVTAQHRQMLDQVMEIFNLSADFDLNVMAPNQTLTAVTCKVLKGIEEVFQQWLPDLLLVQGDTTTVMAAALAAFYHKIAVGHVEAGLRTGNIYSPWPPTCRQFGNASLRADGAFQRQSLARSQGSAKDFRNG